MNHKISVLIKEPGRVPRHVAISNTLENLQRTVGGYIETVTLCSDLVLIVMDATDPKFSQKEAITEGILSDLYRKREIDPPPCLYVLNTCRNQEPQHRLTQKSSYCTYYTCLLLH